MYLSDGEAGALDVLSTERFTYERTAPKEWKLLVKKKFVFIIYNSRFVACSRVM